MAFVLDTNFVLTLNEIGQVESLSKLNKDVLIPKIVKDELKTVDIESQCGKAKNLKIVNTTDLELTDFLLELSKKLETSMTKFILEMQDAADRIRLPPKWICVENVLVQNVLRNSVAYLSKVFTNDQTATNIIKKDTQTQILGHADVHVCAIVFKDPDNCVMTMDTAIWAALRLTIPNSKERILPVFSSLRIIFKDEPNTFIDALVNTISGKRYKFAKNISNSDASRVCYDDLDKSIDDVLSRYISSLVDDAKWSSSKVFIDLIKLRDNARKVVAANTAFNGELSFNDDQFIKELKGIKVSLNTIEEQIKKKRN
jgi:hypothetical protein